MNVVPVPVNKNLGLSRIRDKFQGCETQITEIEYIPKYRILDIEIPLQLSNTRTVISLPLGVKIVFSILKTRVLNILKKIHGIVLIFT